MGGKGGGYSSPPPVMPQQDNSGAILEMMKMMLEMNKAKIPDVPDTPTLPDIAAAPNVNLEDEIAKAEGKAKEDEAWNRSQRKGYLDTILTSPLLDEQEAVTTANILGGA